MLVQLMLGIRKFKGEPYEKMRHLFEQLSTGQDPDIHFAACSDSRVVLPLIIQSKPGEFFSTRNIGNIIPRYTPGTNYSEAGAIEYAIEVLKIKHIIVCGHSDCGAMKALLNPSTDLKSKLPASFAWLTHSQSVLEKVNKRSLGLNPIDKLELMTKENVKAQLDNLKTHPSVAKKLASGELTLHGWYYGIAAGEISILDPSTGNFDAFELALQKSIIARKNRIVEDVAKAYLSAFTRPSTAQQYRKLMFQFSQLNENVYPIWNEIGAEIKQRIWDELGGLYASESDPAFIELVEQCPFTKLDNLKDFQKDIQASQGYYFYCSEVIKRSGFFNATKSPIEYQQTIASEIVLGSAW